jgi:hypothetical protein
MPYGLFDLEVVDLERIPKVFVRHGNCDAISWGIIVRQRRVTRRPFLPHFLERHFLCTTITEQRGRYIYEYKK